MLNFNSILVYPHLSLLTLSVHMSYFLIVHSSLAFTLVPCLLQSIHVLKSFSFLVHLYLSLLTLSILEFLLDPVIASLLGSILLSYDDYMLTTHLYFHLCIEFYVSQSHTLQITHLVFPYINILSSNCFIFLFL